MKDNQEDQQRQNIAIELHKKRSQQHLAYLKSQINSEVKEKPQHTKKSKRTVSH